MNTYLNWVLMKSVVLNSVLMKSVVSRRMDTIFAELNTIPILTAVRYKG